MLPTHFWVIKASIQHFRVLVPRVNIATPSAIVKNLPPEPFTWYCMHIPQTREESLLDLIILKQSMLKFGTACRVPLSNRGEVLGHPSTG